MIDPRVFKLIKIKFSFLVPLVTFSVCNGLLWLAGMTWDSLDRRLLPSLKAPMVGLVHVLSASLQHVRLLQFLQVLQDTFLFVLSLLARRLHVPALAGYNNGYNRAELTLTILAVFP